LTKGTLTIEDEIKDEENGENNGRIPGEKKWEPMDRRDWPTTRELEKHDTRILDILILLLIS